MSVWSHRFDQPENELLEKFNASIGFDQKLFNEDIEGSIAHLKMLEKQKILSSQDARILYDGLMDLKEQIATGKIDLSPYEDIHMAIEALLTENIGEAGKRLHTARSRNDQVAVDLRLFVKRQLRQVKNLLVELEKVLVQEAEKSLEVIMPGYTHLQRAQPITFAHWLMAYANMFKRDILRVGNTIEVMDESPLGSGALATTTHPIDREYTAMLLGFSKPMDNSLDGVADRDYCIEALSDLSLIMMHLSRMSEELISFSSYEFGFIRLDDSLATGSSIMPQKKNPDLLELIRGKTARVYGSLNQLLTLLKGLPLAYNKDLQEDKEAVFDAFETVEACITMMILFMSNLHLQPERMLEASQKGYLNATDLADYLTKKGIPFRKAYEIVGDIIRFASSRNLSLEDISLETYQEFHPDFTQDLYQAIDLLECVNKRNVYGGPAPQAVAVQIEKIKEFIENE